MAEGGFGGNSAVFLRKIEASPATLQFIARHHRKILFSLEEKIRRAQNEKSKEYFSVVWRAERAVAGLASSLGVLRKMGSDFFKQTPHTRFWISDIGCLIRNPISDIRNLRICFPSASSDFPMSGSPRFSTP
jgi:hypothetical protein